MENRNASDFLDVDIKEETESCEIDIEENTDLFEIDMEEATTSEIYIKGEPVISEIDIKEGTDLSEIDIKEETDLSEINMEEASETDVKEVTGVSEFESKIEFVCLKTDKEADNSSSELTECREEKDPLVRSPSNMLNVVINEVCTLGREACPSILEESEVPQTSAKFPKWTEQQTYMFVKEYTKHPCLFDVKSLSFKNRSLRNAAMLEISQKMNVPHFGRNEVYNKIRSIRSTYSQELRKIKDSTKSGAATDDIYTSKLKWFALLYNVLNQINIEHRNTHSNLENDEESPENTVYDIGSQYEDENTPIEIEEQPSAKKLKKRHVRDLTDLSYKVKSVSEKLNTQPVNNFVSEFDIFGASVAAQLKNMPLDVAIRSQLQIQNFLSNTRLEQLLQSSTDTVFVLASYQSPVSSWLPSQTPPSQSNFAQPQSSASILSPPANLRSSEYDYHAKWRGS